MVDVVLAELNEIKEKYGDERRTEISDDVADIDNEDLIPVEDIVVILTKQGYIKRVDPSEFRMIKRGGVGVKGMKTKEEDLVEVMLHTNTHTDILFFTNRGKVYRKRAYQIQAFKREGKGLPVINLLKLRTRRISSGPWFVLMNIVIPVIYSMLPRMVSRNEQP